MKKLFYFTCSCVFLAFASCGNKTTDNSDSLMADDSVVNMSDCCAGDSLQTSAECIKAEADTASKVTEAVSPSPAKEEAQPSKNNKQIDKLIKQCNNDISDIKREAYEGGKPMDPAELQFSDVRSYIGTLKSNVGKLKSMQSEMTEEQKQKYNDIEAKANKIFKEIDL